METFTVVVTLVVKAETALGAQHGVIDRLKLHEWLAKPPSFPPYPDGALLYFGVKVEEKVL